MHFKSPKFNRMLRPVTKPLYKGVNKVFEKNTFKQAARAGRFVVGSGTSVVHDVIGKVGQVTDHLVSNPMLYIAIGGVALIIFAR